MVKVNNDHLCKTLRILGQDSDDASLTVSLNETVFFGYRECSLWTHGAVVVINPYDM